MTHPDLATLVDTIVASMGGSPTSEEVEAAALSILSGSDPNERLSPLEAVQVSISLASCASRRSPTQRSLVYDAIRRSVNRTSIELNALSRHYAIPVPPIEIFLRDSVTLFAGHPEGEVFSVSESIWQAGVDASVSRIHGPFLDLSLPGAFSQIDILPELLALGNPLRTTVQIGTMQNPPEMETFYAISMALGIHRHRKSTNEAQVAIVVNGCERRAFGARAHSDSEAISVATSIPGDFGTAAEYGSGLASRLGPHASFQHIEHRLNGLISGQTGSTSPHFTAPVPITTLQDGLPATGGLQNRMSLPADLAPEQLVTMLHNRLFPAATAGQTAGLVIDFRPV